MIELTVVAYMCVHLYCSVTVYHTLSATVQCGVALQGMISAYRIVYSVHHHHQSASSSMVQRWLPWAAMISLCMALHTNITSQHHHHRYNGAYRRGSMISLYTYSEHHYHSSSNSNNEQFILNLWILPIEILNLTKGTYTKLSQEICADHTHNLPV